MRILHPTTLKIIASRKDISKAHISHVWSEIFKWKASGKSHPKMFIDNDYDLGCYMAIVSVNGWFKKCNLDASKIKKLNSTIQAGWYEMWCADRIAKYFDDNYLFSDACSLYYKGINIFPDIFGDDWRKYVPVESLKEIIRQCDKTINK